MKRRNRAITIIASVALLLGLGGYGAHRAGQQGAARASATSGNNAALASAATGNVTSRVELLSRPAVRAYQARVDFQEQARRFFAEAGRLAPAARQRQAQLLETDIDRYERAGDLSAGETLMLRIGLIRATETDPARQMQRTADLAAAYQVHAERRNAAFLAAQRDDRAFNDYKTRENRIVTEVMAMPVVPGGLSRNEYLRRRLQHEREIAYGRTTAR
ncbi:hypothetical protein ACFOLC_15675 [Lysobacter cavernae]|uniref:Lipase chaperone n=1 Tax=Lysobacter cavernae TaxID=1685901 RepID=A0ABV7RUL9_9GAMM